MQYRRAYENGATYFFTVVTYQRQNIFSSPENVTLLREAMRFVKQKNPFTIEAMVVLPDHVHCLLTLPPDDANFSLRWQLIKTYVTREAKIGKVWQPRFWEHLIRDDLDFERHADYIHYNPVKHGLSKSAADWPHSSFKQWVQRGVYPPDWGEQPPELPDTIGNE